MEKEEDKTTSLLIGMFALVSFYFVWRFVKQVFVLVIGGLFAGLLAYLALSDAKPKEAKKKR